MRWRSRSGRPASTVGSTSAAGSGSVAGGTVSFAGSGYRVGRSWARQFVEVAIVAGSVQISAKRIAYGKFTNFEGDTEHGKSLVTTDLAARATRGDAFPDGVIVAPAALLVIATEDDDEDTIVPRLAAAEADLNACFMLEVIQDTEGNPIPFTLPDDMDVLTQAIADVKLATSRENVIRDSRSGVRISQRESQ